MKWWRNMNKAHSREYHRQWSEEQREAIITILGGRCRKCGFTDRRALQVDHVDGGGNKERKDTKRATPTLARIIRYRSKYQLLCANCNWIKRHEERETTPRLPTF